MRMNSGPVAALDWRLPYTDSPARSATAVKSRDVLGMVSPSFPGLLIRKRQWVARTRRSSPCLSCFRSRCCRRGPRRASARSRGRDRSPRFPPQSPAARRRSAATRGLGQLLFGDLLGVSRKDVIVSATLAGLVVGALALLHRQLLVVGFDR